MKKLIILILSFSALNASAQLVLEGNVQVNSGGSLVVNTTTQIDPGATLTISGTAQFLNTVTNANTPLTLNSGAVFQAEDGDFVLATNSEAQDLTLGSTATLVVPSTTTLDIAGTLTNNNTTGGLTLEADANGAALLKVGQSTGTGKIIKYFYLSTVSGWRHIAIPVQITLSDLADDLSVSASSAPAAQQNVKYWNASPVTPSGTLPSAAEAIGWQTLADGQTLTPLTPIALYTHSSFFPLITNPARITGEFSAADKTFDIYNTYFDVSTDNNNIGWNMVANPFLAHLDPTVLLADATNFGLANKALYLWDPNIQQYRVLTATTTTPAINNDSGPALVPPMHAFWVKGSSTLSASPTAVEQITLSSSHTTVANATLNHLKTEIPQVRINVNDMQSGYFDEVVIIHHDKATEGFEPDKDAFKLSSDNSDVPSLSIEAFNKRLAIQSLQLQKGNTYRIPIYVKRGKNHALKMTVNKQGLEDFSVWLEEVKTGAMYNIEANDVFVNVNNEDLFYVVLNKETGVQSDAQVLIQTGVDVISFAVTNPNDRIEELTIYNSIGQVFTRQKVGASSVGLPNTFSATHLLVHIRLESGEVIVRQIINPR